VADPGATGGKYSTASCSSCAPARLGPICQSAILPSCNRHLYRQKHEDDHGIVAWTSSEIPLKSSTGGSWQFGQAEGRLQTQSREFEAVPLYSPISIAS